MSVTLDSLHLDLLLLGFGLAALACVMAFLVIRPGRKRRTEVATLLSRPLDASPDRIEPVSAPRSAPTLPDHSIFISYRRIDSGDIVGRLYDHLTSQLGQNAVFKDVDSLR